VLGILESGWEAAYNLVDDMSETFETLTKNLNGYHEGCNYLALPNGFCTKCGSNEAMRYDGPENGERRSDSEFNALKQAYHLLGEMFETQRTKRIDLTSQLATERELSDKLEKGFRAAMNPPWDTVDQEAILKAKAALKASREGE